MSDDGADMGVMADRALKTIFGAEQPAQDEQLSPEEFERTIRESPMAASSYGGAASACARLILEALEKYPQLRDVPYEGRYLTEKDGNLVYSPDGGLVLIQAGLHDALKRLHPDGEGATVLSGLTGFMWGWACNAVQNILGKPPVPNPAILDIS